MATTAPTSLLSTHKTSSTGLRAHLHPLVLLTLSDYITRHTLRNKQTPIVGALLGQHNGRDISLEHAFECETIPSEDAILLHEAWFKDRLQQYKDVHPAMELVGWFTTAPASGPESVHVPIHQQVLHTFNETAVLLAFHPSSVLQGVTVGGKLPLTIYESVYESGESGDRNSSMEIDGAETPLDLKFRELPYGVETGEAEMISVDFVARGGGNATAVDASVKKGAKAQASQTPVGQVDGKGKAVETETKAVDDSSLLSAEDEELIASLTARANAVKMLHARIQLLKSYLTALPTSYLNTPPAQSTTNATLPPSEPTDTPQPSTEISHPLLRSIHALLSRLPLLLPPTHHSTFRAETLAEKSDVELVSLLGSLGRSVKEARVMGMKFGVVDSARAQGRKDRNPYAGYALGTGDGLMDDSFGFDGDGSANGGGGGVQVEGGYVI